MFRLTQQSQALKERNTGTPIIPCDSSGEFSNAGVKHLPTVGGTTKPDATRQSSHLPLEGGWKEGVREGRGPDPCPRLFGSGV